MADADVSNANSSRKGHSIHCNVQLTGQTWIPCYRIHGHIRVDPNGRDLESLTDAERFGSNNLCRIVVFLFSFLSNNDHDLNGG